MGVGGGTNISADKAAKIVDKTGFKVEGNGNWQMDIPGVGGAMILDETDTAMGNYGAQKTYSYTVWDKNYQIQDKQYAISLNDAKYMAKENLKNLNS